MGEIRNSSRPLLAEFQTAEKERHFLIKRKALIPRPDLRLELEKGATCSTGRSITKPGAILTGRPRCSIKPRIGEPTNTVRWHKTDARIFPMGCNSRKSSCGAALGRGLEPGIPKPHLESARPSQRTQPSMRVGSSACCIRPTSIKVTLRQSSVFSSVFQKEI